MVEDLPPRQREVLRFIVKLTHERHFPPTLSELAEAMGLRNRMTVHQHVTALKNQGMVHWEQGLNRSLRVIGAAEQFFAAESGISSPTNHVQPTPAARLPLAGTIAAGRPIDAYQTDEYLEVESRYADTGCY